MDELEKVINALECRLDINHEKYKHCLSCKYRDDIDHLQWACMTDGILEDALALLKAQQPILLENQHKPYGHFINANSPWISRCPKCGKKIEGKQTRFCKYCGQAVKWDGFDRKTLV